MFWCDDQGCRPGYFRKRSEGKGLGVQDVLEVRLFVKYRAGKGAYGDHFLLVDAGVLYDMIYQLVANILAFQFIAYFGVLDNDLIGSGGSVYDLGEDIAVFFDKIGTAGTFHFVLDEHKNFY
jgi:hypothetical protein